MVEMKVLNVEKRSKYFTEMSRTSPGHYKNEIECLYRSDARQDEQGEMGAPEHWECYSCGSLPITRSIDGSCLIQLFRYVLKPGLVEHECKTRPLPDAGTYDGKDCNIRVTQPVDSQGLHAVVTEEIVNRPVREVQEPTEYIPYNDRRDNDGQEEYGSIDVPTRHLPVEKKRQGQTNTALHNYR